MKRTLALSGLALLACIATGAAQAGGYGQTHRHAQPHPAGYTVYNGFHGYTAPLCTVVQKRSWVYGYGWVYRDMRICR